MSEEKQVLPSRLKTIDEAHPLTCDFAEDARYIWPEIWKDCCALYIQLFNAVKVCRDINDAGEEYASPNADAAQALCNLFALLDETE